jgi:hypothetical protein
VVALAVESGLAILTGHENSVDALQCWGLVGSMHAAGLYTLRLQKWSIHMTGDGTGSLGHKVVLFNSLQHAHSR